MTSSNRLKSVLSLKGTIGIIAHCDDCKWITEDYHIAMREVGKHCRKTGHRISVERTKYYEVKPNSSQP